MSSNSEQNSPSKIIFVDLTQCPPIKTYVRSEDGTTQAKSTKKKNKPKTKTIKIDDDLEIYPEDKIFIDLT